MLMLISTMIEIYIVCITSPDFLALNEEVQLVLLRFFFLEGRNKMEPDRLLLFQPGRFLS